MVDVEISRFPWTYSKHFNLIDGKKVFVGFRVRIDYIIVTNPHDPFLLDLYHFTSLSDRMDNAQLAQEAGLDVSFGQDYIIATPHRFSSIYKQIFEYDNICASHLST